MRRLFKNGSIIFSKKQTSILSAAVVIMATVSVSRFLGLLRDRFLAGTFFGGNEWQLDVYFAAFRIPDMVFQLLVLGALSAAFIPVFSGILEENKEKANAFASTLINFLSLFFLIFSVVIFIFAGNLAKIIAPTFSPNEISLMVNLIRIMFLAQFFFGISNFLTGIIQSNQRFLVPALAPVVYNLGIIFGIVVLSPEWGIYGPVFGVVLGSLLHFLIQIPLALKLGFRYCFSWNFKLDGVREVGRLMVPRTLGLAVNQIELTVAVYLATSLTSGSLAIFYFAQHLMNLPVGLFGSTISQAALPSLSKQMAKEKMEEFKNTFLASFSQIMFLALPAGMILLILRIPLVRIVFGAPNFPWKATLLTGKVLAVFSLSIFAQAAIQLLVRGFYALHNTKTPFLIGAFSVLVNVFLSFLFILEFDLGVLGLAWAITLASLLQAFLLIFFLNKKVGGFDRKKLFIPFFKTSTATLLSGMALWAPMRLMDKFIVDTTRVLGLVLLTVIVFVIGMVFYLTLAYLLRIEALSHFTALFKRFSRWQSVLQESEEIITTSSSDLISEET